MAWRPVRWKLAITVVMSLIVLSIFVAIKDGWLQTEKSEYVNNKFIGERSEINDHLWPLSSSNSVKPSHSSRDQKNPYLFHPLPAAVVESVRHFVFFIGYARSSHSIIGSILDAHPNVVIAHEYSLFTHWKQQPLLHQNRTWLYNTLYNNSCYNFYRGLRRKHASKKGYSLNIENSWQGRYKTEIKVIGDKAGGMTAKQFRLNRRSFMAQYELLQSTVKVPVHVIHVVRNPYDNIATMLLFNNHVRKSEVDVDRPYVNLEKLQSQIVAYFNQVRSVVEIIDLLGLNLIEVHSDDLVHTPDKIVHKLCRTFELVCSEEYVSQCTNKIFKTESKSRFLIKWTPFLISMVGQEMKKYPFFNRYSFYH